MTEERAMKNVIAAQRKFEVYRRRLIEANRAEDIAKNNSRRALFACGKAHDQLLQAHEDLKQFDKDFK